MTFISLIIPIYNAARTIEELVTRSIRAISDLNVDFEVIAIDDGSTDESWSICEVLANSNQYFRAYRLEKNVGQHIATACGILHSKGKYIVTIDDDLEYYPEDINELLKIIEETNSDVVYGIPQITKDITKRLKSTAFKTASRQIEGKRGSGSSFRIMNNQIAKLIAKDVNRTFFIDEVITWYTTSIIEIKVRHQKGIRRSHYRSKLVLKHLFKLTFSFGTWPLRLMTIGGTILSSTSFVLGTYYFLKKTIYAIKIPGYSSLIVTIFFSTGLTLLCFSALGYYLRIIIELLQKKPAWNITDQTS